MFWEVGEAVLPPQLRPGRGFPVAPSAPQSDPHSSLLGAQAGQSWPISSLPFSATPHLKIKPGRRTLHLSPMPGASSALVGHRVESFMCLAALNAHHAPRPAAGDAQMMGKAGALPRWQWQVGAGARAACPASGPLCNRCPLLGRLLSPLRDGCSSHPSWAWGAARQPWPVSALR